MTWFPWFPWEHAYLWGLRYTTAAQVLFVLVFATTKWWRYRTGRALFTKSTLLAVILVLTWASLVFTVPHLLEVATVLIWGMGLAITYLLWSVIRQKWLDRQP